MSLDNKISQETKMRNFKIVAALLLTAASCSKRVTLPVISELNLEAKEQLGKLGNPRGVPSEQSMRLGVKSSELIKVQNIQVTKVFKQDDSIMLVSKLSLASKKREYSTNVIITYKDGQKNFQELVKRLIVLPKAKTLEQ
jgi:hypothetical protein